MAISHGTTRRGSIIALLLTATMVLSVVAAGASTVAATDDQEDTYSVVQGDQCTTIEPVGHGHQSVEEFYDYRHPDTDPSSYTYSSYGTTHLQEDDTSILALFEGSDGLSLVMVHDQLDGNTAGGSATFQINDLPEDGEWVVEDDNYDGADDVFDHRETSSRITWVWGEARTDGAAFNGGLEDDFAIEIVPSFNEEADFRFTSEGYDGQVTDWEVISGPSHDRERTSLDLHQPIEIRSGGCTAVSDLSVDDAVDAGEPAAVEATVTNQGDQEETVSVTFEIDGEPVDEQEVTVPANDSVTIDTDVEFDEGGTYTVSSGNAAEEVDVADDETALGEAIPGFGITVAVLAILTALVARRRL